MERNYGIKLEELMDFFCKGEHVGFSEQEIQKAEEAVGASLPETYRHFLRTYGKDRVNTVFHRINEPDEICTTYQVIKEALEEEWEPEFEEAVQNESQEDYSENEYFHLWQLPAKQWNTITANYVLIWCENQGVWNAGYLLQDLLDGKPNPPVYISTEDDFITFEIWTDTTEQFILEILFQAAYEYGERYTDIQEIKPLLAEADIDLEKLKACGRIGTCMDNSNNILYFYCEHSKYNELVVVDREEIPQSII